MRPLRRKTANCFRYMRRSQSCEPFRRSMDFQVDDNLPIMSLTFEKEDMEASFFTTITTLGTPLDLTTQELRIESLFPADTETKELFSLISQ
jgi:hypothetical protein